jgi:5-methylcytosine-specific restriction endonuclease McrA
MSLTTRCLDCGIRTKGSRCPTCEARMATRDWATRRQVASGWEWGRLRDYIRARDRGCQRCGSARRLEVHHVLPLAQGGDNRPANLRLLCHQCHRNAAVRPREPPSREGTYVPIIG